MQNRPVLIFDFDGVLAQPWSHPEKPYAQVIDIIKALSPTHHICLASFNPRAKLAVKQWGLQDHFSAMRYGAIHEWREFYHETYRSNLTKSNQIAHMLHQIGLPKDHPVYFFDDDPINIEEVTNILPHVCVFTVDEKTGLQAKDIPSFVLPN